MRTAGQPLILLVIHCGLKTGNLFGGNQKGHSHGLGHHVGGQIGLELCLFVRKVEVDNFLVAPVLLRPRIAKDRQLAPIICLFWIGALFYSWPALRSTKDTFFGWFSTEQSSIWRVPKFSGMFFWNGVGPVQ